MSNQTKPTLIHVPHHDDDDDRNDEVCSAIYAEKVDEVLGLVEALNAIIGLCGGYDDQSKALTKIAEDAIKQHAAWVDR